MVRTITLLLLPLLLLATLAGAEVKKGEEVVCYFSSWAVWRPGDGKFDVEDIDPFLCTTLVFGFTGLSNETWKIEVLDPWNELCPGEPDGNNCAFERFVALTEQNPDLTVLLAVGGWREGSTDYSVMAGDPEKRRTFIESTEALIIDKGFHGLDMDWEYPASRGGVPEDKENYVTLLSELRVTFDKHQPPLLLTSAVPAGKPTIDIGYDVPKLIPLFDKWHLMGYDYHGAWDNYTHHNAPLCGYYLDQGVDRYFNVKFTVDYYISLGVPPEIMYLGIATYGRCFTLDDIDDHGMLADAHNPGAEGPYIRIPGTLGANEICERLQEDDTCTVEHDPYLFEPYFWCSSDKIWCGYDDQDSVYLKARHAKNMGLGGVMVWTIDTDDFRPMCYSESFHLIKTMKRALEMPQDDLFVECPPYYDFTTTEEPQTMNPSTDPTEPPTDPPTDPTTPDPTTQDPVTTWNPLNPPDCEGLPDGTSFGHADCNKYWVCVNERGVLELCAPGTLWDSNMHICNWEDEVDTSNCNMWDCMVDNTYHPHPECDKYVWCYQGSPHIMTCANCLFWSQNDLECLDPSMADTSECTIPDYCRFFKGY